MEPNQPHSFSPQPSRSIDGINPVSQPAFSSQPVEQVTPAANDFSQATMATEPVVNSVEPAVLPQLNIGPTPSVPAQPSAAVTDLGQLTGQSFQSDAVDRAAFTTSPQQFQPNAGDTSAPTPQVSVFQNDSGPNGQEPGVFHSPPGHKRRFGFGKKKLLTLVLPLVLLFGGAAAGYFGYIVPNNPQNIWNQSLANMGKGYDKLTDYSADIQKTFKGVTVKGSYKAEGPFAGEGTIDSNSLNNDSNTKVGIKLEQGNFNIETRSLDVKDSEYPDMYFKVSGIKSFFGNNTPAYSSIINAIDGNWISIDHAYLNELANTAGSSGQKVSAQDITDFQKAFGEVSKEWVFTDNPDHQVLKIKQKIGKESQDNRSVYHYKTQIDKTNLKSYIKALRDKLKDTKVGKAYLASLADFPDSDIDKTVDELKDTPSWDIWVDTHTKLMHKIRIGSDNDYTEISQDYQGGDTVPFGMKVYRKTDSETDTANVTGSLDMKANKLDLTFEIKAGEEKVTGNLSITQNTTAVNVERPKDAKSIQEILNLIFPGFSSSSAGSSSSGSVQDKAEDIERQTDIKSLHAHLEAYYAQNGYYPTLANLNDSSWRAKNMKALNKEALREPTGNNYTIEGVLNVLNYSYAVTPVNCTNSAGKECTKYVLTATLSTGKKYTKASLN